MLNKNWTRTLIIGIALAALLAQRGQSAAQPPAPQTMARYFPPTVDLFAALRTDAAYIDALDVFWLHVTEGFPDGGVSFSEAINRIIQPDGGVNVVNFVGAWLGDYAAVGIEGASALFDSDLTNDHEARLMIAAPIKNVASAYLALLGAGLLADTEQIEGDPFTLYVSQEQRRAVAISRELLLISLNATEPPLDLTATLADAPAFQNAIAALPAESYDALAYVDTPQLSARLNGDASVVEALSAFGFNPPALRATSAGLTLLDARSAAVDVAQVRGGAEGAVSAFDPTFARYIPADASFVMQTTDLSNLAYTLTSLRASLSASDTAEDTFIKLEELTRLLLQLDLREDILRWTGGNYAIFVDFTETDGLHPLHFGVMIEATDPASARRVAAAFGAAAAQFLPDEATQVSSEQIVIAEAGQILEEVPVTLIHNERAAGALDVIIGANDDIFFITTRDTAIHMLSQGAGLVDSGAFAQARGYLLDNPLLLLYMDGDGVGRLATLGYNLLAPSETVGDLIGIGLDALPGDPPEAFAPYFNVVDSSSISAAQGEDGSLLLRLVVTLAE